MPADEPFQKSHVEIGYSDANQAHWMYCDPEEGRLPEEGTDEAATDTRVLELLGVEPELGNQFTVTSWWTTGKRRRPLPFAAGGSMTRRSWQSHSDPGKQGG